MPAKFPLVSRWNTPMEEDAPADEHRATWGQAGAEVPPPGAGGAAPPPTRKRPLEEEEDDLDDDVKRRLIALQGGARLD